jgi:hypothetical protein
MMGRVLLAFLLLGACSGAGDKREPPAQRGSAVLATPAAPAEAPAPAGKRAAASKTNTKTASGSKPATAGGKPALVAGTSAPVDAGAPKLIEQEELKTEEPEANPFSESVTLKLTVTPQAKALVLWGAKQMAHLEPGKMDAELTRPRGSGPLDLEIKAEGYLPYHTRLYADRNDKLSVRIHRVEEAPNLFGYNRSPDVKKAEAEKTAKAKPETKATKPEKAKPK